MNLQAKDKVFFIYADDDQDDHYFLSEAIDKSFLKFECKSVYDGSELLQLLEQAPELKPQFVVMDLNMRRVDGFATLAQIRSRLNLDKLPVFMLSTSRDTADIQKARSLGVAGYYTKPASPSELKDIVEEMALKAIKYKEQ